MGIFQLQHFSDWATHTPAQCMHIIHISRRFRVNGLYRITSAGWCVWNRTQRLSIWLWLNPLEFHHLFGIYNVDSFRRMGANLRTRDCFLSAITAQRTMSNETTISATKACNLYIRHFSHLSISLACLLFALLLLFVPLPPLLSPLPLHRCKVFKRGVHHAVE